MEPGGTPPPYFISYDEDITMLDNHFSSPMALGTAQQSWLRTEFNENSQYQQHRLPNHLDQQLSHNLSTIPDDISTNTFSDLLPPPPSTTNAAGLIQPLGPFISESDLSNRNSIASSNSYPSSNCALISSTGDVPRILHRRNSRGIQGTMSSSASKFYCTYPNCGESFGSKRSWSRHEEGFHFPQHVDTCHVDIMPELESLDCPVDTHRSKLTEQHLDNCHYAKFCCNETPSNLNRFCTNRDDKLVLHLRDWHDLDLPRDVLPLWWKLPVAGAEREFGCGFCPGTFLASWKDRVNHIGNHFAKEGLTMAQWSEENQLSGLGMNPAISLVALGGGDFDVP